MEKIIINGYVGQDASIKEFNGVKYTSFSIAVDKSYKGKDGNKVQRTNWYYVMKLGEGLAKYITKGTHLIVMGEPKVKMYKDHQGVSQVALNINADFIEFAGKAGNSTTASPTATTPTTSEAVAVKPSIHEVQDIEMLMHEDELPF
jgi:single-strand DNA-binding protein